MTFKITRKPLRIELTYLKLETENAYTFGLGCSTMIIMVFESTNKIFSSGLTSDSRGYASCYLCVKLAISHRDGARLLLWEKKRKEIIPRNFRPSFINKSSNASHERLSL